jgi:hypothetical protein
MAMAKARKSKAATKKAPRTKRGAAHAALGAGALVPVVPPQTQQELFKALEKVLALYSPPAKMWVEGSNTRPITRLTVPSPVVVKGAYGGKPVDLELATLIPQTGFVGFYLMPLYIRPALARQIPQPLRKLLRGKTCFHIRAADDAMLENVRLAVDAGTQLYRDRGWL